MHRRCSFAHLEPMEVVEAHPMLGVTVSLEDCFCLILRLVCNFAQSSKVQGVICREGLGLEIELQVLVHLRVRRHKKRRQTVKKLSHSSPVRTVRNIRGPKLREPGEFSVVAAYC